MLINPYCKHAFKYKLRKVHDVVDKNQAYITQNNNLR